MLRALAATLPLLLLAPRMAGACPACYLPGELAASVKRARTIYVGQSVRSLGAGLVELKVVRVLRGSVTVGQLLQAKVLPVEGQGKTVLIIHPAEWMDPSPAIGGDLEDEVRFLMQRRPRVASAEEAVRRLAGVSVEARAAGARYLRGHRRETVRPLIAEVERLRPLVLAGRQGFFDEHRLQNLVGALLGEIDAPARAWALGEVDRFLHQPWRARIKDGVLNEPGARGLLLKWLLSSVPRGATLRGELRRRLEAGFGRLAGEGIALAVFALVGSGTTRPADHTPLPQAERTEAVALGLYLAGSQRAREEGEGEVVRALLVRARGLTRSAALRAAVDEKLRTERGHPSP